MLYIENPNKSTKKLLKLINKFIQAAEQINIQKLTVFLYILVMNKTIQFTKDQKKNNILRNRFNKINTKRIPQKLQTVGKKLKKIEINGKTIHVCGSRDLIPNLHDCKRDQMRQHI